MTNHDRMNHLGTATRQTRSAYRGFLSLCAVLGCASLVACGRRSEPDSANTKPIIVVVSGDTSGWIVPCGCTTNQSGGLLRRGAYLNDLRQQAEVIYLDAGGAPSGTAQYDVAKFQAILEGQRAMGLALHNLGGAEAALGAAQLRRVESLVGEPLFLSANVRDAQGERIGVASRVLEVGGRRVLITGVLAAQFAAADLQVSSPRNEILAELKKSADGAGHDVAIVLAYLPEPELRELATQLPEVDAVIGGPTGQAIAPERVGSTVVAAATNKGKFLIELQLPRNRGEAMTGKAVEITEQFPDDSEQQENLTRFYKQLAEHDFTPRQTSFASQFSKSNGDALRIAGTNACRGCHAADCQIWDATAHAAAWETLESNGSHVDSYCQQCHVTGYGLPGGFESVQRTPEHTSVSCESCHGPSQAHAEDPTVRTPYFQNAASTCVRCHDRENSPHFDYSTYWPQIEHGIRTAK